MARKKKKTKVKNSKQKAQRKQKKQQRRAKRTGDYSAAKNDESTRDEIAADALATFAPTSNSAAPAPEAVMEHLFFKAADTAHLISEPEFEDVGFDPFLTSNLFAEAGEKRGFDDMESKSDEEKFDTFAEILDDILADLLADGVREEFLDAIDSLRTRLKKSKRRREDVARLAALQMILDSEEPGEPDSAWPAMGLVQAMVQRSIGVGLEIMDVFDEFPDDPESVAELMVDSDSPLKADNPFQKIAKRVENSPLLKRFMTSQFDDIWDEGVSALFNGQLILDIFTEDEQNAGADIFHNAQLKAYKQMGFKFELDIDSELDDETERELRLFMSTMDSGKMWELASKTFMPQLMDLVEGTFSTEERRDGVQLQLERLSKEHLDAQSKWCAFLVQAKDFLYEEPDEFIDSDFLLHALMGEIKPLIVSG